jgi:CAAX prenyl protease-like protein
MPFTTVQTPPADATGRRASARPYVLPFAAFILLLGARDYLPVPPAYNYGLRAVAVTAVLLALSRPVVKLRPVRALPSAALGAALFAVWILPDLLVPGWRSHWLFSNALLGSAVSSMTAADRMNPVFLASRVAGSALLVPIIEELFWRAFVMRALIAQPFWSAPLGKYTAASFWIAAVLFASEHGVYWEVGLAAGIAYNWWMVRTRSLADCILAHAVTNGCLAAFVLVSGRWEYWL